MVVVVGVVTGVFFDREFLRLEAGEAGAEPMPSAGLSQELLLFESSSEDDDGDNRSPGDSSTTGT